MTLRERLARVHRGFRIASWLLKQIVFRTGQRKHIVERLQRRLGNQKQIIEVLVPDSGFRAYVQMGDGRIEILPEKPKQVSFRLEMDVQTVYEILEQKRVVVDPATGMKFTVPFTPVDAFNLGRVRTYGKGASPNAALFFMEIWPEVFPAIRADLETLRRSAS